MDAVPSPFPASANVIALLAPHAGHRYSGGVAAHAFALVQGQTFDTVAVLGPLHQPIPGASGGLLTSAHSAYATPLGLVPVDHDSLAALARYLPLTYCKYDPEHSIEIELPFLQVMLTTGFHLIPLMLRDQSVAAAQQVGMALAAVLRGKRALLVASSDLSHFYPQEAAVVLDRTVLAAVTALDAEEVIAVEERGEGFACGRGAIAATIGAAKALGATRGQLLRHATSGDITGDYRRVVGYAAAAFFA